MEQKPSRQTHSFNNLRYELKGSEFFVFFTWTNKLQHIKWYTHLGNWVNLSLKMQTQILRSLLISRLKILISGLLANCIIKVAEHTMLFSFLLLLLSISQFKYWIPYTKINYEKIEFFEMFLDMVHCICKYMW
jgi:hypothetical protein